METVRAWLRDAHLLNRTGACAAVGVLGLVTATPPSAAAFGIATLLALAGAVVRFWAEGMLSENQELVTSGPYAYVRHPLYAGGILIAVSFLILNGNLWFVIPAVIGGVVLYLRVIDEEEAALREWFDEDFESYREQVPAIFPWNGRIDSGGDALVYSLEKSLSNKAFNGIAVTLGMLGVFYVYAHGLSEVAFRVGIPLIVIALMAVRGSRRAAEDRIQTTHDSATMQPEADPVASEPMPEPAPVPSPPPVEPAAEVQPAAEVPAAPQTVDVPTPPESPLTTVSEGEADVVDSSPADRVSADEPSTKDRLTQADAFDEVAAAAAGSAGLTDDLPLLHAEMTEAELASLTALDEEDTANRGEPEDERALGKTELEQRALLDQIDADEVAEALGALELIDDPDDEGAAKGPNR